MGEVIGFVLSDGSSRAYVSADNGSVPVAQEIGERAGQIDVAILFAGAVQMRASFAGSGLTERIRLPERGLPLTF